MACPTIITGEAFLTRILDHIDCQAQVLGSYGYLSLSEPGSLAAVFVTGLITLFILFFGVRMMFGERLEARALVFDVLKIGIVLTLAFSWPAFRTLVYDVTFDGPAQVAAALSNSDASTQGMVERLQALDNRLVDYTSIGTGRITGQVLEQDVPGAAFEGIALQDRETLGSARLLFLASTIGVLALLRIAGGLLLALTPLIAGLLLFVQTRSILAGWAKGLVLIFVGSVGATIVLSVKLAVLEPLLSDALRVRGLGFATPSTPTEVFAISLAFLLVQLGMLWLLARIAFYHGWMSVPSLEGLLKVDQREAQPALASSPNSAARPERVESITNAVQSTMHREVRVNGGGASSASSNGPSLAATTAQGASIESALRPSSSFRRNSHRTSRASARRDSAA